MKFSLTPGAVEADQIEPLATYDARLNGPISRRILSAPFADAV
jgi:hypothetical protein